MRGTAIPPRRRCCNWKRPRSPSHRWPSTPPCRRTRVVSWPSRRETRRRRPRRCAAAPTWTSTASTTSCARRRRARTRRARLRLARPSSGCRGAGSNTCISGRSSAAGRRRGSPPSRKASSGYPETRRRRIAPPSRSAKETLDDRKQGVEVHRLGDEGAVPAGRDLVARVDVGGDEDHGHVLVRRVAAELFHELGSVHGGHVPVEEDEAWLRIRPQVVERLAPTGHVDDLVPLVLQRVHERIADVRIVVDDEDRTLTTARRHHPPSAAAAA